MAGFSVPIKPVSTISGNDFRGNRIIEEASQTFKFGTPVQVNATDGGLQAWDGTTITNGLAGISYEAASNLGTTGQGAPKPFTPVLGVGAVQGTFGSVPNEPSAVNIAHGAPLNDGRCGLYEAANSDTIFSAAFGGAGQTAVTPLPQNVGVAYGLTIDTNGFWFVDSSKTGSSAVLKVTELDPRFTPAPGTNVFFAFLNTSSQILG
jgi:hypothetical protein